MENFSLISKDDLTTLLIDQGIYTWNSLTDYIQNIPYGRNTNRTDAKLVITENRGTCSSKHALLKRVADLHGINSLQLIIGIYKMSPENTPQIGTILHKKNLDYIPEAHCYLKYKSEVIDVTSNQSDFDQIKAAILLEHVIEPNQIGDYKIKFHQDFIKSWITKEKLKYSFNELWIIREQCISNLSGP